MPGKCFRLPSKIEMNGSPKTEEIGLRQCSLNFVAGNYDMFKYRDEKHSLYSEVAVVLLSNDITILHSS